MKWTVKLVAETAPGAVTEHDLLTLERPDQLTLARLGLGVEETHYAMVSMPGTLGLASRPLASFSAIGQIW